MRHDVVSCENEAVVGKDLWPTSSMQIDELAEDVTRKTAVRFVTCHLSRHVNEKKLKMHQIVDIAPKYESFIIIIFILNE